MTKHKNILLPYAYDSMGNLVHIDKAHKEEVYKCPKCGAVLSLNISKIPEGQKYHRRNYFSHPKGSPDKNCSESFLHKLFKERTAECIRKKIENNEDIFSFEWECEECFEHHQGNMLKKAKSVSVEYDLGVCQPDVALLDEDGKVVIVIEVVVTHKPEPKAIEYYKDHKIACLQINVSDFDECDNVEERLATPNSVGICPTPTCDKCGRKKQVANMVIVETNCWHCFNEMKIAMIDSHGLIYTPDKFTEEEVRIANENGAFVTMKYSNQMKSSYYANTCKHCNAFLGQHYMDEYYEMSHVKELRLGYKCYNCVELEKQKEMEAIKEKERKLNEKIMIAGCKTCPKCGGRLIPKLSKNGSFYGCKNYPKCHYTENIALD